MIYIDQVLKILNINTTLTFSSLTMKLFLVCGIGFLCSFVEFRDTVEFVSSRYIRISSSDDRYPSSNILAVNNGVSSVSECSLMALNTSDCFSFFFNAATMSCALAARLCASQLISVPGFQHFYLDKPGENWTSF